MSYWMICVITAVICYLATELVMRHYGTKKVNVVIKDKDGSKRTVTIISGRDAEVDMLIREAKEKKRKRR